MATLSMFYGIVISMYNEANERHHARPYPREVCGVQGSIGFDGRGALRVSCRSRKLTLVRAWIVLHREELEADWAFSEKDGRRSGSNRCAEMRGRRMRQELVGETVCVVGPKPSEPHVAAVSAEGLAPSAAGVRNGRAETLRRFALVHRGILQPTWRCGVLSCVRVIDGGMAVGWPEGQEVSARRIYTTSACRCNKRMR